MRVSAPGYRATERALTLNANQVQSFVLEPLPCTLLVDDDLNQNYQTYFQAALNTLGESHDV